MLHIGVVIRGRFTITGVQAQFRLNGGGNPSLVAPKSTTRIQGFGGVDEWLRQRLKGLDTVRNEGEDADRLSPWDAVMWLDSGYIANRHTAGWYSVVRWSDRWGVQWEFQLGEVRRIEESAAWNP